MPKYIHPKLWRKTTTYTEVEDECDQVYYIEWHDKGTYNKEELLVLWFEEVKEEVPEWIRKAYDYYQTPMPARDKNNDIRYPMKFKEAIEKYMPEHEQQKVTAKDLKGLGTIKLGWVDGDKEYVQLNTIKNLLEEKWLFTYI